MKSNFHSRSDHYAFHSVPKYLKLLFHLDLEIDLRHQQTNNPQKIITNSTLASQCQPSHRQNRHPTYVGQFVV